MVQIPMTSALIGVRPTEFIQTVGDNVFTEAETGMIEPTSQGTLAATKSRRW